MQSDVRGRSGVVQQTLQVHAESVMRPFLVNDLKMNALRWSRGALRFAPSRLVQSGVVFSVLLALMFHSRRCICRIRDR